MTIVNNQQDDFADWCASEEARQVAEKEWATDTFYGVHIRVWRFEDPLCTNTAAEAAIKSVQEEAGIELTSLFVECHNRTEGFDYDHNKAEQWDSCAKEILKRAYMGQVPEGAFVTAY